MSGQVWKACDCGCAVAARAAVWALQAAVLAAQDVPGGPGTSLDWTERVSGASLVGACVPSGTLGPPGPGPPSLRSAHLQQGGPALPPDRSAEITASILVVPLDSLLRQLAILRLEK